jgi:glycosyltransferase involved in cell wall biosynthesis
VVPCYNEERRLDRAAFLALSRSVRLLFVDDGSSDGTRRVLEELAARSGCIKVLDLPQNEGKSEAVRQGLILALADDPPPAIVGYLDADLATPAREILRIITALEADDRLMAVLGSRVARLGSRIVRRTHRHYLGRVYATAASAALGIAVYDTQCGAKAFRVGETFRKAIESPFRSAWSFDVLLIERLLDGVDGCPGLPLASLMELPLEEWSDVPGSTMQLAGSLAAFRDLWSVARARRAARASIARGGAPRSG